jgi:hypothetical protein
MLCIFQRATDQSSRDVIAIAAMALGRALHIQRLTVFIEQLARQRTLRRLGLTAFAPTGCSFAQPLLDPFPQRVTDYSFVLPWMAFVLVADLADVD